MHATALTIPFAVATSLLAQTTHLVGPGGLPQIRDALAIAAPGDVIHVLPGTYAQFTATVGVTIRALQPGTVTVACDPAFVGTCPLCPTLQPMTFFALPVGQFAHVVDIDFDCHRLFLSGGVQYIPTVHVTSGGATFDRCTFVGDSEGGLQQGLLVVEYAIAHLVDCTLANTQLLTIGPALVASHSTVTAVDTSFDLVGVLSQLGGTIRLFGSYFHGAGLTVTSTTSYTVESFDSQVWISDTTMTANGNPCPFRVVGQDPQLDRCTLVPSLPCPSYAPPVPALGVARLGPPTAGAAFSLQFTTVPNGFVAVFASLLPAGALLPGILDQPNWLDGATLMNLGIVAADAMGHATATWTLPGGSAATDRSLWFQGITGFALPLQASPVTGGTLR